jgi:hypothetical protein
MDLFSSISSTNSRGWRLVGFPERSLQAQAAETLCCTRHIVFLTIEDRRETLMPLLKSSHEGE